MTDKNKRGSIDSLRSIYEDVLANRDKDPLEHILILTYEFDDQQLLNLVSGRSLEDDFELRQNDLKFISDLRPVVFYDARKTKDSNQLPHFMELFPVRTRAFSCHHSKAYVIVTQRTIRLVLGSMNLTRTGLFANREVFHDFCWSKDENADFQVMADFCGLIREGYGGVISRSVQDILENLDNRIRTWGTDGINRGLRMLASGYPHTVPGMAQLGELWSKASASPPTRILAVSPFFDKAGGGDLFSDALCESLGATPDLVIVTDKDNKGLSKKHYGTRAAKKVLYPIHPEISETERKRIQEFNNNLPIKDLAIERKLHAKILVMSVNNTSLVYMGSANFTNKAWNGDNLELGLAWLEKGDPKKIEEQILACLQVSITDAYQALPDQPDPDSEEGDDDEGYTEESCYPEFLHSIVLKQTVSGESVQFEFQGENLKNLSGYSIRWGRLPLRIDGGQSQELRPDEFLSRLMGGKNLAFEPKFFPGKTVYIPFIHSPELFQQRDMFIFTSSEEWLQYYLGYNRAPIMSPGEFIPGEDDAIPPESDTCLDVDREGNVVISMQHYLNLFSGVEREFTARSTRIAEATGEGRTELVQKTLLAPLDTYARILGRERGYGVRELVYCFKMGELVLFCRHLSETVPEMADFTLGLAASLDTAGGKTDSVLQEYLNFCTAGGQA